MITTISNRNLISIYRNRESLLAGTAMIYGRPVSPSDWPWHFYDPSIFSRQTPWIGTFRGPLVVNGYAHIFFTPSSAQHDDLDSRGTRSGNAEIHNMTSATGPSIAYVATMVCLNISSCNSSY